MDQETIAARFHKIEVEALILAGQIAAAPVGAGENVAVSSFAFNSVSPVALGTIAGGGTLNRAILVITTPFSAGGATLQIGTAGSPGSVMAAAENIPQTAGQYEIDLATQFPLGANIQLTITPAGSVAGAGFVVLKWK